MRSQARRRPGGWRPNAGRVWLVLLLAGVFPASASATDQMFFPATDNVITQIVNRINAETVRVDVSAWYLNEHAISIALVNKSRSGVPVRVLGDRVSIFEIDPNTKAEFYYLASNGVPIRLRYNPTYYPEIDHMKMAIFAGQDVNGNHGNGTVEFGSANWATSELMPASSTDYPDETVMFTDDPVLVSSFKARFDQIWNDTTYEPPSIYGGPPYLKDWDGACALESACSNYPGPLNGKINTQLAYPELAGYQAPPDLIWGQGPDFGSCGALCRGFNTRLVQEINNESAAGGIQFVVYRLTVNNITQALLNRKAAGVPIQIILDTGEYLNRKWPEFWLTHANMDKLWAAGVQIRQRAHNGITHMKTLITSTYATNASSNYAAAWQRDNDYFISSSLKPAMYTAVKNRFAAMWANTSSSTGFVTFQPQPPDAPALSSPASGATGVSPTSSLIWNRAVFATDYDVYLGTSSSSLTKVGNTAAQLVNDPPLTYAFAPTLCSGTTYFWQIVSRTFATPANGINAPSAVRSFTTSGTNNCGGGTPPAAPTNPSPASGATGVSTSPTLTWSSGATGTTFNVAFGTTNPPSQVATGLSSPSYSPGGLSPSTTYFWRVTAVASGGSTQGALWSFVTAASGGGGALPAPWASQDVGSVGTAGNATFSNGTFSVSGAGSDIWGSSDSFRFVYQALSGDSTTIARVTSEQNTNAYAKAGIMIRESLSAGAAHVILDIKPDGSVEFMTRSSTGGDTSWLAGSSPGLPVWLRLTRSGSTVTGATSPNGTTWTTIGTTTLAIASTADVGLIVTSHNAGVLNTSQFDNVSATGGSPPPPPPPPPPPSLPSPWTGQDVGSVGRAGSASFTNGVFTVTGAGGDIWGSADAFQFVSQPITGDGQLIVRITAEQNTNAFAKAGVMLRQSTAAGSAHVMLDIKPNGEIEFMSRSATNGQTNWLAGATFGFPTWLRLVRAGNTVTASASTNGTTWTTIGSTTTTISSSALIGMIVNSHDTSVTNTATFDNVTR